MYKLVRIYLDPETVKFDSAQDVDEFHKALGRMVMFGFSSPAGSQDVQAIELHIDKDKEVIGCFQPVAHMAGTYTENRRFYALNDAFEAFKQPYPFVMGAIPSKGEDGKTTWGFHS